MYLYLVALGCSHPSASCFDEEKHNCIAMIDELPADEDLVEYVLNTPILPCSVTSSHQKLYCPDSSTVSKMSLCVKDKSTIGKNTCMSAQKWLSLWDKGKAPNVILQATAYASLQHIGKYTLQHQSRIK